MKMAPQAHAGVCVGSGCFKGPWVGQVRWKAARHGACGIHYRIPADAGGYFVATVAGQAVAAISVVNHDPAMAFLGLHLRRPGFRRPGIGHALWQHALVHAGDRTVGLDGVATQQRNYARPGYRPAGATLRLEGLATGANDKGILDLRDRRALVNSLRNALSGLGSGK